MMTLTRQSPETDVECFDRRRDDRTMYERQVRMHEPLASRTFDCQTLDSSTTGLRLKLSRQCRLRPGRIVSLHLGLSACGLSLAQRRHNVPARVVWVSESSDGVTAGLELLAHINTSAA